jgi:deoxyribonuclease V
MEVKEVNQWDLNYKEAVEIQRQLVNKLNFCSYDDTVRFAAAVDVSTSKMSKEIYAAAIVWDSEEKRVIESRFSRGKALFPYIPGLLSFRETPLIAETIKHLKTSPDVILVDGHGYSHPRRMGCACHLGLMVDVPTIGCAKKKLVGNYVEPKKEKFSVSDLIHNGEKVGLILRSRSNVKPIFISPGNNIDLPSSLRVVKSLIGKYRIPEPLRQAHTSSNIYRRKQEE